MVFAHMIKEVSVSVDRVEEQIPKVGWRLAALIYKKFVSILIYSFESVSETVSLPEPWF
jgi:hypothetical protein